MDDTERTRVEAEFVERMQMELRRVPVEDHLTAFMTSLSSIAFLHLGLSPDTAADRDMDQSRLAVDSFKALTEVLAGVASSETVGLFRSTLAQMQMAYVAALGKANRSDAVAREVGAEPTPAGDPGGASDDL